jgi:hypothetical protein
MSFVHWDLETIQLQINCQLGSLSSQADITYLLVCDISKDVTGSVCLCVTLSSCQVWQQSLSAHTNHGKGTGCRASDHAPAETQDNSVSSEFWRTPLWEEEFSEALFPQHSLKHGDWDSRWEGSSTPC